MSENWGYVRVSSTDQNEERQMVVMHGVWSRDKINRQSEPAWHRSVRKKSCRCDSRNWILNQIQFHHIGTCGVRERISHVFFCYIWRNNFRLFVTIQTTDVVYKMTILH